MPDIYPIDSSVPRSYLVSPELQPDFTEIPGTVLEPGANIGDYLADRQVRHGFGDAVAVIHHESNEVWTFAELAERSGRLAGCLVSAGLRTGDRVVIRSRNRPEAISAAIAVWKAGGVVVPTPFRATASELAYLLDDTEATLVIADTAPGSDLQALAVLARERSLTVVALDGPGDEDWIDATREMAVGPAPQRDPAAYDDHVAVVWHTGGTTGRPKSCYHTHKRFLLAGLATGAAIGARRGDVWCGSAPLGHALGLIFHTTFTLLHGATVVTVEDFHDPAAVVEAIDAHDVGAYVGMFIGWSRMADLLESTGRGLPSLTRGFAMWQTAASSRTRDLWRRRGVELLNNFGSTSFAGWPLVAQEGASPPGSLGIPAPGFEVLAAKIVDTTVKPVADGEIGQLAVRGPAGLTYWRRPDLQARDVLGGWTLQDDLIRWDASGSATYLGRTDFLISSSGFKIAPGEVEDVLTSHPAVAGACVVGAEDPERGEVVAAGIVLAADVDPGAVLEEELKAHCKSQLSSYKVPRLIMFVDSLPRDHVGKIRPRAMRDMFAARLGTDAEAQ